MNDAAWASDQTAAARTPDSGQLPHAPITLIGSGRSGDAEALLRHVLTREPNQVDATRQLARLLIDRGRASEAVAALAPALEAAQDRIGVFTPLVIELCGRGVTEAEPLLRRIADHVPYDAAVNFILAERLQASGEAAAATAHFQRAADAQASDFEPLLYRSIAMMRLERRDDAEASFRHLLTLRPRQLDATIYLARLLMDRDSLAEATELLAPAIEAARDRLYAFTPLVAELCSRGVKEAEPMLRRIADHVPHDIAANFILADRLVAAGEPAAAAVHFQRAAEAPAATSEQRLYKAVALLRLKRRDEAEASLRQFLALDPRHVEATCYLARLLINRDALAEALDVLAPAIETPRGRMVPFVPLVIELAVRGVKEAEPLLDRIIESISGDAIALAAFSRTAYYCGLANVAVEGITRARAMADTPLLRVFDDLMLPLVASSVDEIERWIARFRTRAAALATSGLHISEPLRMLAPPPHYAPFFYGADTRPLYAAATTAWQALHPGLNWTAPHCEDWTAHPLNRRLRVGFLTQPTFPLIWGIARELDRTRFEVVHLYEQSHHLTPACGWHGVADRHVPISDTSLTDAQRTIADQELDVLIHMPCTGLRYFLSHARLAPVQCVICEPSYTDGVPNLDYYISWDRAEPKHPEDYYLSTAAFLTRPPCWIERDHTRPAKLQRGDFDLPQEARWYVCPGSAIKIHPDLDAAFAQILHADPQGILILLRGDWMVARATERRIRDAAGPAADRVRILPGLPADRCHALLSVADAVLDTWPVGGMSSSWAAIDAGIPTVALPAATQFGRWLTAMYETIGVTDLIAADAADYARLAVRLANDAQWRHGLAARIKERNAVFIEDRAMVREVETFLVAAVAAAHRGERPTQWRNGGFASR